MGTSPDDMTQMLADWEGGDQEALHDYAAAESLFQEALALRRKLLGSELPDVAHTLYNFAYMMFDQRKYQEAARLPNKGRRLAMRDFLLIAALFSTARFLFLLASTVYSKTDL